MKGRKPREIIVVSGKGGTGKTSITASLAYFFGDLVLSDCDVDTPNLSFLIRAGKEPFLEEPFFGEKKARVKYDACTACGECLDVCRFGAISMDQSTGKPLIDDAACEGCGVCAYVCRFDAIELQENESGKLVCTSSRFGPFVYGRLNPGEGNSGKLVTLVREKARELASEEGKRVILVDGPPGIGCPVISAVTGADYVVIVTECSISGQRDLERIMALVSHFKVPCGVVINKADIEPSVTDGIKAMCGDDGIAVLGLLPFDKAFVESLENGIPIAEAFPGSKASGELEKVYRALVESD